jgi:hypothetical protein
MEKKIRWYLAPAEKHLWKNLFNYLNGQAEVAEKLIKKVSGEETDVIELKPLIIQYIISDGDMFRSYRIYFNQDGGEDIDFISAKDASALLKGGEPSSPKVGKVYDQRASLAAARQILNKARSLVAQAKGTKKRVINVFALKEKYVKKQLTIADLKGDDRVVAQVLGVEFNDLSITVPKTNPYLTIKL